MLENFLKNSKDYDGLRIFNSISIRKNQKYFSISFYDVNKSLVTVLPFKNSEELIKIINGEKDVIK